MRKGGGCWRWLGPGPRRVENRARKETNPQAATVVLSFGLKAGSKAVAPVPPAKGHRAAPGPPGAPFKASFNMTSTANVDPETLFELKGELGAGTYGRCVDAYCNSPLTLVAS